MIGVFMISTTQESSGIDANKIYLY